ncbi:hypothetical protein BAU15_13805 [Enterococcus sp. JM4C]|uniref:hypothetical protein n=1 Tax=Candidatus Enterococcus huntleyi TaxID=1857217 RepID=UPI00137A208F|nr:hypothetical protein [Enterococcus sp. JM4C]KAF1298347.1 hypothetical protein BAU15_13805 [Enterococcus sp. JM4C]
MKLFKFMSRFSLFLFAIQLIATSLLNLSFPKGISYFFVGAQAVLFVSYAVLLAMYWRARVSYNKRKPVAPIEKLPTVVVQSKNNYRNKHDKIA